MSILFGIISLFLSILVPTLVLTFTDFQIMGFSLFFVIPVGAIAIGYIAGFGYYKGLVKSNIYVSKKHIVVGLFIALICIFGLKYAEYSITYLDPITGGITYALTGVDHISNYEIDGYGKLNFINYTRLIIESTPISFSYRARSMGEISNPTVSWVFAFIDFLGVIAGCLYVGISKRTLPYCHSCQLYNKELKLIKIPTEDGENFFEELNACFASEEVGTSIISLLDKHQLNTLPKNAEHYQGILVYCENCKAATLRFELYKLNSKKQLVINSSFELDIKVDSSVLDRIIDQIPA
jgi:hypothetical protein